MLTKALITISGIGVALTLAAMAGAQQPASDQSSSGQQTTGDNRTSVAASARHDLGHYMTECLIHGNDGEIALAKIAEQRATDPEVKRFAQKMIEDHTAFLNKLRTVKNENREGSVGTQGPSEKPGVDVNVAGTGVHVQTGESRSSDESNRGANNHMAGGAHEFLKVQREVAQQSLQSQTQELSQKEGAQFDRCYVHGQVAAHMKMADELTVYSRHASSALQPILQEGLQATKQHLEMVKQLAERLDSGTNRTATREGRTSGQ
jgi:predicted outer membrane protein